MPALRGIDLSEGIKILHGHRSDTILPKTSCIAGVGEDLADFNNRITRVVQAQYEHWWDLKDPSWGDKAGCRIFEKPPRLLPNERIEKIKGKSYYIVTEMFIALHFDSMNPINWPPKIKCSNEPIEGEWWL